MSKTEPITFGVIALHTENGNGVYMDGTPNDIRELAEFFRGNKSPEVKAAFTISNEPYRTDQLHFKYFTDFKLTLGTEMSVFLQRENTTLLIKGSKEVIEDLAEDFITLIEQPGLRTGSHFHFEYMESDGDSNLMSKNSMSLYLTAMVE